MVPTRRPSVRTVLAIEPLEERYMLDAAGMVEHEPLEKFTSLAEYRDFYFNVDAAVAQHRDLFGKKLPANYFNWWYGFRDAALNSAQVAPPTVQRQDYVRIDGEHIVLASGGKVLIIDAPATGELRVRSEIATEGEVRAVYVQGDRLTVISQFQTFPWLEFIVAADDVAYPFFFPQPWKPLASDGMSMVQVSVYDIADPSQPALVEETYLDGICAFSAAAGDQVYITVENALNRLPYPQFEQEKRRFERQSQYRRRLESALENVLPWSWSVNGDGEVIRSGPLSRARQIYRPDSASYDRNLVTVASFAMHGGVTGPEDTVTLAASSYPQIYLSPTALYVLGAEFRYNASSSTGQSWTEIYRVAVDDFDLDLTDQVSIQALVPYGGFVDETGGFLRLIAGGYTDWQVFVFDVDAGTFDLTGHEQFTIPVAQYVSGFHAAFLGNHALFELTEYVTGYQSTSTIQVIDLSDAADPTLAGQLHLDGRVFGLRELDAQHVLMGIEGNYDPQVGTREYYLSVLKVTPSGKPKLVEMQLLNAWADNVVYQWNLVSLSAEKSLVAIPTRTPSTGAARLELFRLDADFTLNPIGQLVLENPYERTFIRDDLVYALSWEHLASHSLTQDPSLVQTLVLPGFTSIWIVPPVFPRPRRAR